MINYKNIKNLSCLLCGLKGRLTWDKGNDNVSFDHTFIINKSNHYDMISHKITYSDSEYYNDKMIAIDIFYKNKRYFLDIDFNRNWFVLGKILCDSNDPFIFNENDCVKFKFDISNFNLDININSITNYVDSLICFQ